MLSKLPENCHFELTENCLTFLTKLFTLKNGDIDLLFSSFTS